MFKKSPALNAWAAISKDAIFFWSSLKVTKQSNKNTGIFSSFKPVLLLQFVCYKAKLKIKFIFKEWFFL